MPLRAELVAKDMIHQGQAGLEGIILKTKLSGAYLMAATLS